VEEDGMTNEPKVSRSGRTLLRETELDRARGGGAAITAFKGVDGLNAERGILRDPSLTVEDRVASFKPPLDSGKGS
jgi:hypothetical protein